MGWKEAQEAKKWLRRVGEGRWLWWAEDIVVPKASGVGQGMGRGTWPIGDDYADCKASRSYHIGTLFVTLG